MLSRKRRALVLLMVAGVGGRVSGLPLSAVVDTAGPLGVEVEISTSDQSRPSNGLSYESKSASMLVDMVVMNVAPAEGRFSI